MVLDKDAIDQQIKINTKRILCALCSHLSRRQVTDMRKIVLNCNDGRGYLGNPKYIVTALDRLYPGFFDFVLIVDKESQDIPSYIRQVKRGTSDWLNDLATARFWISNSRFFNPITKRPDQIYIQTWHACLGPKKCERDVEENLDPSYVWNARRDSAFTDLMIADNRLEASKYQHSFWYGGPVLKSGMPRNRPLMHDDPSLRSRVHEALGVPCDAAICLYAPTFRRDGSVDEYGFNFDLVTRLLQKKFDSRYVFVYRLHPNLANATRPSFLKGYVDATDYMDTQELLAATDVLISDYSSIMEDFVLTGRPGFTYVPDFERYMDDRGLYYPLSDRPFPVAHSESELVSAISDFNSEAFESKRIVFLNWAGFMEDGEGDTRVAQVIHRLAVPKSTLDSTLTAGDLWPSQA